MIEKVLQIVIKWVADLQFVKQWEITILHKQNYGMIENYWKHFLMIFNNDEIFLISLKRLFLCHSRFYNSHQTKTYF